MKSLLLVLCSLLFTNLCAATLEGASATIPLFVWSDSEILNKHNEQVLDTLTKEDMENSLFALLGLKTKGFIGNAQIATPSTVVLFVEPQLQTEQIPHFGAAYTTTVDGGAFSALKGIVETSKSSFVAPYVTSGISFSLLDSILVRVADEVPVVLVRDEGSHLFQELSHKDGVQVVPVSNFKATSSKDKTNLVVVCLNKAHDAQALASHGDVIVSISQQVSSVTSGNFVGIYTGNAAPSELLWTFPNPNAALFAQPRFGLYEAPLYATNGTTNSTVPRTYMTGTMLEVFMVVIALLTMVFVGICNICALQVPETFETPKPQQKTL